MKTIKIFLVLFIFPFLIFAQTVKDANYLEKLKPEISKEILKLMKKHKVTGVSIALVDNQDIVWSEGFGFADKKNKVKATDSTVYRVGSISKLFTFISAMQLSEKGKLNIDSAYSKYVPEFSIKSRFDIIITPRTLMTHHSGMPGDKLKGLMTSKAEPYSSAILGLSNEYTAYPPNYVFAYSNLGASMVGYLVEKISQERFENVVNKNVFLPLGMQHSSFEMPDNCKRLYSKAYNKGKESTDPEIREVPAGMMVSNVLDLSNLIKMIFADGQFKGKQILKKETLAEMLSQQNTNIPLDLDFKIGLGFFLYKSELNYAGRFVGHGGDTDFFHADLSTLPDHKIGVVVLTNSKGGGVISDKISLLILKKVLAYKEGISAPEPVKKTIKIVKNDSLEGLNNYLGMYSIGNDVFNISKRKGHFYFKQSGQSIYLLPNNKGSFTPKVVLFGLIPIKLWNQEINFRTMGDKDYLAFKNEGLFGVKIQNYTIDDEWKKRVGDYALLNKGNDVYYPEKISLEIKEGLLYFKLRFFNMNMKMILQTVNNNEAVNLGIGRYAMETIYVTKDDKGEEVLHYSGYEFKIIKKE